MASSDDGSGPWSKYAGRVMVVCGGAMNRRRFLLTARWGDGARVVLLQAEVAHRKAVGAQGPQQLVAVVLKGLQPGAGGGPHREQAAVEAQGAAVGGQLGAGDAGPGLPEGRQMPPLLPPLLEVLQAAGQAASGRPWRGHQQRQVADLAGLLAGRLGHGLTLSGLRHPGAAIPLVSGRASWLPSGPCPCSLRWAFLIASAA